MLTVRRRVALFCAWLKAETTCFACVSDSPSPWKKLPRLDLLGVALQAPRLHAKNFALASSPARSWYVTPHSSSATVHASTWAERRCKRSAPSDRQASRISLRVCCCCSGEAADMHPPTLRAADNDGVHDSTTGNLGRAVLVHLCWDRERPPPGKWSKSRTI
eukprot:scaffold53913_cov67-Phaeocystis_antarctica.AAC.18